MARTKQLLRRNAPPRGLSIYKRSHDTTDLSTYRFTVR